MKLLKWRTMTWALLIWSALIVAWMIAAGAGADCDEAVSRTAQQGCEAGAGIGIAIIALIGFFGFAFLTMIWFMTRPRVRPCPKCGEDVKKGVMGCKSCGWNFRQLSGTAPAHGDG